MNKKIASLFLSVIIAFSMACTAIADDAGFVSYSCIINKYAGDGSQEEEEKRYDVYVPDNVKDSVREAISEALINREDDVSLSSFDISFDLHTGAEPVVDELYIIFTDLVNRTPEFYYVFGWYAFEGSSGYIIRMPLAYRMNEDETLEAQRKIDRECAVILSEITPDMDDVEKALTVHDYFALHYDYNDYARAYGYEYCPEAFSMDGLLIDKTAVCQGFSLAYMYVLGLLGIEARFCPSDALEHAWDIVKINGNWYHVDITHDTPPGDYVGWVDHSFFLLSDDEIAKDERHRIWDIETCATDTKYNNFFWRDILSGMYYRNGFWYYATTDNKILKRDVLSGTVTTVLEKAGPWRYVRGSGNLRLFIYGDRIYYNGPYKIYSMDLNGNNRQEVYIPTEINNELTHILGIAKKGGEIVYNLYTYSDNAIALDGIYSLDYFTNETGFKFMASLLDDELKAVVLNNPDALPCIFFASVYDNDGNLVDTLEPVQTLTDMVYTLDFSRPNVNRGYIKVMAWDFSLRPLTESYRVNYQ